MVRTMLKDPKRTQSVIFVDRSQRQWVVLDREGNYWIVPSAENAWDQRQPFQITGETDLQPIPGHYKHLLGLPS